MASLDHNISRTNVRPTKITTWKSQTSQVTTSLMSRPISAIKSSKHAIINPNNNNNNNNISPDQIALTTCFGVRANQQPLFDL